MSQSASGPAAGIPFGPLKGRPFLLGHYNELGKVRPFGPGEYVATSDGSWANEMTSTVQFPNGKWGVVPGLWLVNGTPTHVDEDQALEYAQQSGLNWPMFATQPEAEKFSINREQVWQRVPHGRSDMQSPLWSRQWPPAR